MKKTYISLDGLKDIAKSLDTERQQILSTYNTKIAPALSSSDKYFHVAGLNTNDIMANFEQIFKNVDNEVGNLTNILNNLVVDEYSQQLLAVQQMFNKDFATKLKDYLNML